MDVPNDKNQTPITPGPPSQTQAHNSHCNDASTSQNPSKTSNRNFDDLDDHELCVLATMALNTIKQPGIPHIFPLLQQPKKPDIFEYMMIKQIICSGLKPPYDGSPDKVLETSNLIHIY
jgi:hypothetical protein